VRNLTHSLLAALLLQVALPLLLTEPPVLRALSGSEDEHTTRDAYRVAVSPGADLFFGPSPIRLQKVNSKTPPATNINPAHNS
jgi:hypothetical protein